MDEITDSWYVFVSLPLLFVFQVRLVRGEREKQRDAGIGVVLGVEGDQQCLHHLGLLVSAPQAQLGHLDYHSTVTCKQHVLQVQE